MNVVRVEPKGDKGAALMLVESGQDGKTLVSVWTPDIKAATALIGKPIPADWTQKTGEYGPQAFPPKPAKGFGGGPAWANTEPGERYVQERMDRRTAAMQATEGQIFDINQANAIYAWLRVTSGGVGEKGRPASPGNTSELVVTGGTGTSGSGDSSGDSPLSSPEAPSVASSATEPEGVATPPVAGPANDPMTVHVHEFAEDFWTDANGKQQAVRPGWRVCTTCCHAEPKKKSA